MIPKNEKEIARTEMSYIILLAASVAPMLFIEKMSGKLFGIFILTLILLGVNIYNYYKCRTDQRLNQNIKLRVISMLSIAVALWMFLHVLLMFSPSLHYKSFIFINKVSDTISDQTVYSSGALAFLIASAVLFGLSLSEIIPIYKKIPPHYRSVYLIICSASMYIIINYLILFPGILRATPVIKLIYANENIFVRPDQFHALYYEGVTFDGKLETSPMKWYLDGELIGTENVINPVIKGKYHAEIETEKGIIKTQSYNYLE